MLFGFSGSARRNFVKADATNDLAFPGVRFCRFHRKLTRWSDAQNQGSMRAVNN
jgi:hypothetical protein